MTTSEEEQMNHLENHPRVDVGEVWTDERGDRERVVAEGSGAFVGGMWFTPDATAEGGVRPLTVAEVNRFADLIRSSQTDALEPDLSEARSAEARSGDARADDATADDGGWER
ncbi:hypothetical protein [Pseudonocardia sp. NPDC049635]|uniref:hypothetical protein n=1 Tax=Pseudonocardia sp. NPDC049635 TaxID=3155506 RepID=UPI0033DAE193